jgi:hypothetical protein
MEAARLLRVGKSTVYRKLKEYGLSETDYRSRPETGPDASKPIVLVIPLTREEQKLVNSKCPRCQTAVIGLSCPANPFHQERAGSMSVIAIFHQPSHWPNFW